jgi:hypothetical protein
MYRGHTYTVVPAAVAHVGGERAEAGEKAAVEEASVCLRDLSRVRSHPI